MRRGLIPAPLRPVMDQVHKRVVLGFLPGLLGLGACFLPSEPPPPPPPEFDVPSRVLVAVRGAVTARVLVTAGDDTIPTNRLRFYSTAETFFTVDSLATVRGVRRGPGNVRVVAVTGAAAEEMPEATFPVKVVAASVHIAPPADTVLQPGETAQMGHELTDANGQVVMDTASVVWSSLDPSIAKIDFAGQVTPEGSGIARTVASLAWDSISSSPRSVASTDSAAVIRICRDSYRVALVDHLTSPLSESVRNEFESCRQAALAEDVLAVQQALVRADSLLTAACPGALSDDCVLSAIGRLFVGPARKKLGL